MDSLSHQAQRGMDGTHTHTHTHIQTGSSGPFSQLFTNFQWHQKTHQTNDRDFEMTHTHTHTHTGRQRACYATCFSAKLAHIQSTETWTPPSLPYFTLWKVLGGGLASLCSCPELELECLFPLFLPSHLSARVSTRCSFISSAEHGSSLLPLPSLARRPSPVCPLSLCLIISLILSLSLSLYISIFRS